MFQFHSIQAESVAKHGIMQAVFIKLPPRDVDVEHFCHAFMIADSPFEFSASISTCWIS